MPFNILVVDDSASMRKVLIKSIKMSHIGEVTFFEADHGESALAVARENWIDVIFSDVNMPVMDGLELASKLLDVELTKTTPVILVTSSIAGEDELVNHRGNIRAVVYKPFRPELIRDMLITTLGLEVIDEEDSSFEGADF